MRELFPNLRRILFAVTIFTIMLALGLTAVACGKFDNPDTNPLVFNITSG